MDFHTLLIGIMVGIFLREYGKRLFIALFKCSKLFVETMLEPDHPPNYYVPPHYQPGSATDVCRCGRCQITPY